MPASFSVPIISRISWRSIKAPQAVVSGAVGDRLMDKPQRLGRGDGQRCRWLALTGQDVEHDVAADRTARQCLGAGGLDRIKSIGRYRAQDADHLAITIGVTAEASPYP